MNEMKLLNYSTLLYRPGKCHNFASLSLSISLLITLVKRNSQWFHQARNRYLFFKLQAGERGVLIHHSLLIYHPLILIIRPVLFYSVQLIWIILIIYTSKFREYSSDIFARIILPYCFSQFVSFNIPLQMSSSVQVEFKKRKKGNFIKSRSIELNFSENRFILLALDRWLNGISINSKNLSENFF